jgi:hypothetical protein
MITGDRGEVSARLPHPTNAPRPTYKIHQGRSARSAGSGPPLCDPSAVAKKKKNSGAAGPKVGKAPKPNRKPFSKPKA